MDQMVIYIYKIYSGPPSELDEGPPQVELEEREDARLEPVHATELLVPETMYIRASDDSLGIEESHRRISRGPLSRELMALLALRRDP